MIITCPNCNKQFKIDNSLIPDEGRDLQCGSCNHIWFYNIQEKNNEVLELKQEIISEDIETKVENVEDKMTHVEKMTGVKDGRCIMSNGEPVKSSGLLSSCEPWSPNFAQTYNPLSLFGVPPSEPGNTDDSDLDSDSDSECGDFSVY